MPTAPFTKEPTRDEIIQAIREHGERLAGIRKMADRVNACMQAELDAAQREQNRLIELLSEFDREAKKEVK